MYQHVSHTCIAEVIILLNRKWWCNVLEVL